MSHKQSMILDKFNAKKNITISVVTPIYGDKLDLETLYKQLEKNLKQINPNFEIIMVNDCSPDNAWEKISQLSKQDPRVRGINLSRNFGQHNAIAAGLKNVRGEWCVVMDCDMQDRPEEIPKLYKKALEGYDVVAAKRTNRQDSFLKKLTSKFFYKFFNYLSDNNFNHEIANFGIYSKKIIDVLNSLTEQHRSFGIMIAWLGFKRAEIPVSHNKRKTGKSSYSLKRSLGLALANVLAFSDKPLKITINLGFFISLSSFLYAIWLILRTLIWDIKIQGWTSVMTSIFFSTGLLTVVVGMLGLYIGKIYDEIRNRPIYIISEKTFEE